jgi:FkbM family methyltransferase
MYVAGLVMHYLYEKNYLNRKNCKKEVIMKIYALCCFLICMVCCHASAEIQYFSDSSEFDYVGYDNGNMRTNGEYLVLSNFIKPNTIAFDIGANVGEWSLQAFKQASTIQLYAFEPIPIVFQALQKNTTGMNIQLFNIAMSDTQGTQKFTYFTHESMLSTFYDRPHVLGHAWKEPEILEVSTNTLDNFCASHGIEHIDFLKIDTEGAEVAILQGALQLLQGQRIQYIQFEYGGTYYDAHTTLQQAYTLLSSCNYKVYRMSTQGLIHIPQWRDALENYRYSNYFAIAQK